MRVLTIALSVALGFGLIGLAIYYGFVSPQVQQPDIPQAPSTVKAERGSVQLTVTAPGQLAGVRKETLRMPVAGIIETLHVREGDTVKSGDLLASIDRESLEKAVGDARTAVEDAREELTAQLARAQEAILQTKAALKEAELTYPTTERSQLELEQAKSALGQAQTAYNKAVTQLEDARKARERKQADLNTASTAVSTAQTARDKAATDLTTSQSALAAAQATLTQTKADQATAQTAYDQAVADGQPQEVLDALLAALDLANQAVVDAQTVVEAAETAIPTHQQLFDQAEVALRAAQGQQTNTQAAYNAADAAYQSADAAAGQAHTMLVNADYAVKLSQLALDQIATGQQLAQLKIDAAKHTVEQAQHDLDIARSQTIDPKLIEAVNQAQRTLDSADLHAPIDGIVVELTHQAGDAVPEGEALLAVIDPGVLEARTTVIEEDLPLVKTGQQANLFFDAAPDAEVTGVVDRIVPERVQGSDRPLYTVVICLNDTVPEGLLPGMNAEASIIIDQRTDVVYLPRSLVRVGGDNTATIEVWNGTMSTRRKIGVGLRGDANVEITSGLQVGEQVVAE